MGRTGASGNRAAKAGWHETMRASGASGGTTGNGQDRSLGSGRRRPSGGGGAARARPRK